MQGGVKHLFHTFGAITMLFVEVRLKARKQVERLEAIARVIAECHGNPHISEFGTFLLLTSICRVRPQEQFQRLFSAYPLHLLQWLVL